MKELKFTFYLWLFKHGISWQCSKEIPMKEGGFACCIKHKFHFGKHKTHEQCGGVEF